MTIQLVQAEVDRFLASNTPQVFCLSGKWGVGKTYLWNDRVRASATASNCVEQPYSYVSLFGISSLADLKFAVVQNTVDSVARGTEPSIASFETLLTKSGLIRGVSLLSRLKIVSDRTGDITPAFFLTVRDQVVCFDDLERIAGDLTISEILGLASFLKEQRGCRVAILLNDDALRGERKEEWDRYLEKAIDSRVKLAPTAPEAASIAICGTTDADNLVEESCRHLGISNIRTIRRAAALAMRLYSLVAGYHEAVVRQSMQTLVLLVWCILEPDEAPSLAFVTTQRELDRVGSRPANEIPENEAHWNSLLDTYGFGSMDELDRQILAGATTGFFDGEQIRKAAQELDRAHQTGDHRTKMIEAWGDFNYAFGGTERDALQPVLSAFRAGMKDLAPSDLNAVVVLLKDLGRRAQARKLITDFVEANSDRGRSFFDDQFIVNALDPDVHAAMQQRMAETAPPIDLAGILERIGIGNTWNQEDKERLLTASIGDLTATFKGAHGKKLAAILAGALFWSNVVNASPEELAFTGRVREALTTIARESRLNARRLRRLGISP